MKINTKLYDAFSWELCCLGSCYILL